MKNVSQIYLRNESVLGWIYTYRKKREEFNYGLGLHYCKKRDSEEESSETVKGY